MKRRIFLSASISGLGLAAAGSSTVAATLGGHPPLALLFSPERAVGERFRASGGVMLELVDAKSCDVDNRCEQFALQFRQLSGDPLAEGTYRLVGAGDEVDLFLQPGALGPVARIARLVR